MFVCMRRYVFVCLCTCVRGYVYVSACLCVLVGRFQCGECLSQRMCVCVFQHVDVCVSVYMCFYRCGFEWGYVSL